MIVSNIYMRVVRIQIGASRGTAFTIDVEGRQYLVTAAHLLPVGSGPFEAILDGNAHVKTAVEFVPIPVRSGADVAVTALATPLSGDLPIVASMDGMIFGQDCYFLGYPHGLGLGGSRSPHLAFVKRALLSAHERVGGPDGVGTLYLDGHNNVGFSGGPVFFYRDGDRNKPSIAGVVSGYRAEFSPVHIDGQEANGAGVLANSGIVVATDIAHVVEAVNASQGRLN